MSKFFIRTKRVDGMATLYTRIQKPALKINILVNIPLQVDIASWNKANSSLKDWKKFIATADGKKIDGILKSVEAVLENLSKQGIYDKDMIDSAIADVVYRDEREEQKRKEKEEALRKEEEARQQAARDAAEKADVINFLSRYINGMRDGSIKFKGDNYEKNTIKMWNNYLGIMKRFMEVHYFTWDDVNRGLTDSFLQFMESEGYMVSAINKYLTCFRAMVGYAMEQGLHENAKALTAFSKRKIKESDKAKEIYLAADELQALYEMELTGLKAKIRDVFLVGCYTCQRFSDYSRLERENFTTTAKGTKVVRLTQIKTGNVVVIPILNDNLLNIAERYGYEIPNVSDVVLNRYIKEILGVLSNSVPSLAAKERTVLTMKERAKEERGEIPFERDDKGYVIKPRYELVSSHTARRSGITNLYLTGKFDTYQMMSISGHKDIKTFTEYIKLSSDEIADAIAEKARTKGADLF